VPVRKEPTLARVRPLHPFHSKRQPQWPLQNSLNAMRHLEHLLYSMQDLEWDCVARTDLRREEVPPPMPS
jgi:hypothetical protein